MDENTLGEGMVLLLLIMLVCCEGSGPSWVFYLLRCDGRFANLGEGVMGFVEICLRTSLMFLESLGGMNCVEFLVDGSCEGSGPS